MPTARDLRAYADERLFAGDFPRALYGYAILVRLQPIDLDARLRIADALLAMGEIQNAALVYTAVARYAANAGYPLRALVALKILSALEPQLEALLRQLADLYAVGSPRLGRGVRPSPGDPDLELPAGLDVNTLPDPTVLVQEAARIGAAIDGVLNAYPEKVPPIPLFSELPADAFASVLTALKLVRTRPAELVLREGDTGQSFYVIARGGVKVSRRGDDGADVALATLGDGSIFGEMALVSAAPRSATVAADGDCDLLEFDRDALAAASREIGTIARALDKFTRERLLQNLLATAPLFRPLDRKQRLDLVRRFTAHDVAAGIDVISEGQPGQGLFVLLNGEVDVSKIDGDEKVLLATLKAGDVFGEISLLHDAPTTATVTAATNVTVLFLAREYFQRLIEAVPAIRAYVESLGEERLMDTRILMSGQLPSDASEDELVRV